MCFSGFCGLVSVSFGTGAVAIVGFSLQYFSAFSTGPVAGCVHSAYVLNCFSASSLGAVGSHVHSADRNLARESAYKASKENGSVVETACVANLEHIVV